MDLAKNEMEQRAMDNWKKREPWVVQDPEHKREWLPIHPLLFHLHQRKDGMWIVIDRSMDIAVGGGPYKTREQAIRGFYKNFGRPVPPRTDLPRCSGSNYTT